MNNLKTLERIIGKVDLALQKLGHKPPATKVAAASSSSAVADDIAAYMGATREEQTGSVDEQVARYLRG